MMRANLLKPVAVEGAWLLRLKWELHAWGSSITPRCERCHAYTSAFEGTPCEIGKRLIEAWASPDGAEERARFYETREREETRT